MVCDYFLDRVKQLQFWILFAGTSIAVTSVAVEIN